MIIGSVALKHWFSDFKREPKDLDVIDSNHLLPFKHHLRIEFLKNPVLLDWMMNTYGSIPEYCPVNELYTLKISHSLWALENNSWDKHMYDIQFMKEKGCILIEPLFYELYEYWNKVHGKNKRSNLEMDAESFFNNAITYPIPHDTVHELLITHPYFEGQELPTYVKILKDNCEVNVDKDKFNKLTEKEKYNVCFEEIANMGLERYGNLYYKKAYSIMLKKFIISHAPIWEAIWIIQNHKLLMTTIPFDFIKYLKEQEKTWQKQLNYQN